MVKTYTRIAAALSILLISLVASHASAQTAPPKGITISPAYQQVSISADEAQKPVHLNVTNNKQVAQTIKVTFSDFNTLNETGGLFFVGSNPTELQKKYGLTKWISIDPSVITLQPKQTVSLDAVVDNLATLAPGGHYGAINLMTTSDQLESASNNVSIHPVASSLIFLTKLGGDTHKMSLRAVTYSKSIFKLPETINLRFQNAGNTHVIPRGSVTILNSKGKTVSRGIINEDSSIILPETFRQLSVPMESTNETNSYGNYKLIVAYRFDGIDQYRIYQSTIKLVSPVALLVLLALLVLAATAITNKKYGAKIKKSLRRKRT